MARSDYPVGRTDAGAPASLIFWQSILHQVEPIGITAFTSRMAVNGSAEIVSPSLLEHSLGWRTTQAISPRKKPTRSPMSGTLKLICS
jgi:hypothetical protein